jgi:trehalose-6-phosphate synthase
MTARFQLKGENPVPRYVASSNRRLVVVSNRVAVESPKPDSGGLAIAIRAALESSGGIWFGWSGRVADNAGGEPETIAQG